MMLRCSRGYLRINAKENEFRRVKDCLRVLIWIFHGRSSCSLDRFFLFLCCIITYFCLSLLIQEIFPQSQVEELKMNFSREVDKHNESL